MTPRFRSSFLAGAALTLACSAAHASNCGNTSVGFTPLTDLGPGLYHGMPGGLYPGGSNVRPPAHDAAGVAIARAIVPLDTLGQPDPTHGRIVFISIGMSNATQEFSTFVPESNADPIRNPRTIATDCAQGGQSADRIDSPSAPYWDTVFARLRARGSSPLQAQVAWIKEANASPTGGFPASADSLLWNLGTIVRIIHDKLPNVRIAYLTSRIYAGYASSTLNPEPYAYESGFAVQWLIAAQVAGEDSLNYDPAAGAVHAPWLAWGPYLWADGLVPRGDGLTWACDQFQSDGTHPSDLGRAVVADSLLAFVHRDSTTVPWYVNPTSLGVPRATGADLALALAPNPTAGGIAVTFAPRGGEPWRLDILDAAGRRIRDLGRGVGGGGRVLRRWDGRDARGGRARAGVYWARLESGPRRLARRVVMLGSE